MDTEKKLPIGLIVVDDFISREDEKSFIELLDENEGERWKPITKSETSRKVQHYGYRYDYSSKKSTKDMKTTPIPHLFDDLLVNLEKYHSKAPDQMIVNEYYRKQGISKHCDSTKSFGPVITTISLGDETVMIFRNLKTGEAISVPLIPRQAVFMTGESRYEWTHEIQSTVNYTVDGQKKKRGENWRRISLTFRTIKN